MDIWHVELGQWCRSHHRQQCQKRYVATSSMLVVAQCGLCFTSIGRYFDIMDSSLQMAPVFRSHSLFLRLMQISPDSATQIFNIKRACGNTGIPGAITLTATTSSDGISDPGLMGNLFVVLGGKFYMAISNPAAEAGPLVAMASRNATFTPPSPFSSSTVTSWSLNIPCLDVPDLSSVSLAFVYDGTDDFMVDNVGIHTCLSETCGGQYVVCDMQSLNSTKPCTPGYDCNVATCCY
jgi:hypothetical protein